MSDRSTHDIPAAVFAGGAPEWWREVSNDICCE